MRKKLSILMLIMVVGSGSFSFFPGCTGKDRIPESAAIKYDIQGQWTITRIEAFSKLKRVGTGMFTGDKEHGTMVPESGIPGAYNIGGEDGLQVEFFFAYYENGDKLFEHYHGQFINEDYMNGTGTWQEHLDGHIYTVEFAWGALRN